MVFTLRGISHCCSCLFHLHPMAFACQGQGRLQGMSCMRIDTKTPCWRAVVIHRVDKYEHAYDICILNNIKYYIICIYKYIMYVYNISIYIDIHRCKTPAYGWSMRALVAGTRTPPVAFPAQSKGCLNRFSTDHGSFLWGHGFPTINLGGEESLLAPFACFRFWELDDSRWMGIAKSVQGLPLFEAIQH